MSTVSPFRLTGSLAFCLLLTVAALFSVASSCRAYEATTDPAPASVADQLKPGDFGVDRLAVVHYLRPDGDYEGWNLWAWPDGGDGGAYMFEGTTENGGVYAVIPVRQNGVGQLGIIVRKNEWEAKDVDRDRFVPLTDAQGVAEVWLVSGDPRVYEQPGQVDLEAKPVAAFLDGDDEITLAVSAKLTDDQRDGVAVTTENGSAFVVDEIERKEDASGAAVVYSVLLDGDVDDAEIAKLRVAVPGLDPLRVYARDVLSADRFTPLDAELGAWYSPASTTFRTWSPVADAVEVLVYEDGATARAIALQRGEKGVWETTIEGDLHGVPYVYRLRSYGQSRIAADIHARAATADSTRSIVIDLDRTDPAGWGTVTPPTRAHKTDEIIYEIHVRDFTVADDTAPAEHRGKYLGLIHENPGGGGEPSTALSHLLDLGVTAVHLLPIQDFGSERHEYNWGYWTSLFNVPESSYATDQDDPVTVTRELKQAIHGLHEAGVRVILDVVYNHTSSSGQYSPFEQTVPYFYFRTDDDGALRNDAGVGNSVADERPMVRKYIIDSLIYWADEYRVDGYRFDLVGTHRPATVRALVEALADVRPDLTLYGEPWTGGGPTYFPKGAQRGLEFAVFNDHLRNAIRGDLDGTAIGFATGPGGDSGSIVRGVAGAIDDFTTEPIESVVYASAHDNLTLWDKIVNTQPRASDAERRAMQKLALGIVLTSQGVAFLHGGSDFARTKGGEHNSYNLGDAVNKFDWQRKAEYHDVFEYVAGLVALRRSHPAFRMHDDALVRDHVEFLRTDDVVAYTIDGDAVGDEWSQVYVAYNGQGRERRVELPVGTWSVAVDAKRAGTAALGEAEDELRLPPYSMAVLFRD